MSRDLRRYARDPVAFIDAMIPRNEKGQPWRLAPYQRRVLTLAFRWEATGRLLMRLLLWAEPKKSGKTLFAAALALWWGFVTPDTRSGPRRPMISSNRWSRVFRPASHSAAATQPVAPLSDAHLASGDQV